MLGLLVLPAHIDGLHTKLSFINLNSSWKLAGFHTHESASSQCYATDSRVGYFYHSLFKKLHVGLALLIRTSFLALVQPFNSFSLAIAS